jgi:hypothetical protein
MAETLNEILDYRLTNDLDQDTLRHRETIQWDSMVDILGFQLGEIFENMSLNEQLGDDYKRKIKRYMMDNGYALKFVYTNLKPYIPKHHWSSIEQILQYYHDLLKFYKYY